MLINNEIVNRIINEVDIVDVVQEYVPLTLKSKNFWGVCPFHNDSNPSMSVNREKKIFKCFSCGTGGDVITFVSKIENISFQEAVKKLASRIGIEIDVYKDQKSVQYERYYKAMEEATKFYEFYLKNSEEGLAALSYLKSRNINEEIIAKFRIGLAPTANNYLHLALNDKKIDLIDQIDLGLVSDDDGKKEPYDVFRKRIIFPITNQNGQVVAFSGRIYQTTEKTAKYVNSIENPIFHKSECLYNFKQASLDARKNDKLFVFEGFMDVIAAAKDGVTNAVATMGTALTKFHLKAMLSVTKNIVLCFDGDLAGINATKKALKVFNEHEIVPDAIALPDSLDPDEYLNKYGEGSLAKFLASNATNIYDYLYETSKKDLHLEDARTIETFKREIFNLLREIKSATLSQLYLKKMSNDLGVDVETLTKDLGKSYDVSYAKPSETKKSVDVKKEKVPKKVFRAYEIIIKHTLKSKKLYLDYTNVIDFNVPHVDLIPYYAVLLQIGQYYSEHENLDFDEFMSKYINTSAEKEMIEKICNNPLVEDNNNNAYYESLNSLHSYIEKEISDQLFIQTKEDYNKYREYLDYCKKKLS